LLAIAIAVGASFEIAPHVAMVRDARERIAIGHIGELVLVRAVEHAVVDHAETVRHPHVAA